MQDFLFTSESVTEGHPDKVCDQISDAILDAIYTEDPYGRVACETLVTTGLIVISGEITTKCYIDIPKIARQTVIDIGYDRAKYGFDGYTCGVVTSIDEQSTNIAQGVNIGEGLHLEQGAGDQGMMVGYASNETSELMPLPIMLAHKLTMRLSEARKNKIIDYLRPDGKSQITIEYVNGQPKRANTVLVSTQHRENIPHEQIRNDVIEHIIRPVVGAYIDDKTIFHVNPTGSFHMGGPQADTGLTGRKIIVDTYGGMGHHGGGCFSGKDPSKVDRSGAYAARYVAKNVVAAGLADKCEIQVAYAIGVANPVSINVNVFGTGKISEEKILEAIQNTFDLRPAAIIETLNLRKPIYKKTAAYGHFGREEFPWEKTDKADRLKEYLNTSVAPPTPAPTYNATPSSSSYQAPEQSSPQPTNEPFTPPQTTPFDSSGEQQTANTRPGDTSSPFPEPNFDANQSPITPGQNEYREIPRENQNPPIV